IGQCLPIYAAFRQRAELCQRHKAMPNAVAVDITCNRPDALVAHRFAISTTQAATARRRASVQPKRPDRWHNLFLLWAALFVYNKAPNLDRPSLGGVLGTTVNRQDSSYYRRVKGDRARDRADNGKRRRLVTSGRALY